MKRRLILSARRRFFRLILSPAIVDRWDRRGPQRELGARGELEAERYFLRLGYWIIHHSFDEKVGEIDLIVSDGDCVIFVEVKTRSSDFAGDPTEAVDATKQQHISQTARLFAVKNNLQDCRMRFDVISIIWPSGDSRPQISHFQDAFEATGSFQMF